MRRVEVGGRLVEIPVRVSQRSRRLRLVVGERREVEIVVPPRTPAGAVDDLLAEHRAWLERQLAKPVSPFVLGLQRDDAVWIHGQALPLPHPPPLDDWYLKCARERIAEVAGFEAARLGLTFKRITVRAQRGRWGSCSMTGALAFNWRLILAPAEVLTYVVVHELCHRLRHDHSPQFWELVALARPSYVEERAWLNAHGSELLAYHPPQAAE